MNTKLQLFAFSLLLSVSTYAAENQNQAPQPYPAQQQNTQEEVAFRGRDSDNTLYDKNQYRKEWDYRDSWRYQREPYLEGENQPYRPQYSNDSYYYQQQAYNHNLPQYPHHSYNYYQYDYNQGYPVQVNYGPEPRERYYHSDTDQYQVIHGDNNVRMRPWQNRDYWRYNRDAYLHGNNRPFHYPELQEYRQYYPQ